MALRKEQIKRESIGPEIDSPHEEGSGIWLSSKKHNAPQNVHGTRRRNTPILFHDV